MRRKTQEVQDSSNRYVLSGNNQYWKSKTLVLLSGYNRDRGSHFIVPLNRAFSKRHVFVENVSFF